MINIWTRNVYMKNCVRQTMIFSYYVAIFYKLSLSFYHKNVADCFQLTSYIYNFPSRSHTIIRIFHWYTLALFDECTSNLIDFQLAIDCSKDWFQSIAEWDLISHVFLRLNAVALWASFSCISLSFRGSPKRFCTWIKPDNISNLDDKLRHIFVKN